MVMQSRSLGLSFLAAVAGVAAAIGVTAACDGSSDEPPPFESVGTVDAAARPEGSTSEAGVRPLEGEHTAGFTFATSKADGPEKQDVLALVMAGFSAPAPVSGAPGCTQIALALGLGGEEAGAPIATGDVTASVGGSPTFPVLVNRAGTSYPPSPVPWAPGTDLVGAMTGAPGGVPAFTIATKGPARVELTGPAMPGTSINDVLPHPRANDLAVTWTGGAGAVAQASISSVVQGKILTVSCEAPAESGTLTVPAAVFALFEATAYFTLQSTLRTERREGDWLFSALASTIALDSTGRAATCALDFQ